jgi:hypothetical protein
MEPCLQPKAHFEKNRIDGGKARRGHKKFERHPLYELSMNYPIIAVSIRKWSFCPISASIGGLVCACLCRHGRQTTYPSTSPHKPLTSLILNKIPHFQSGNLAVPIRYFRMNFAIKFLEPDPKEKNFCENRNKKFRKILKQNRRDYSQIP